MLDAIKSFFVAFAITTLSLIGINPVSEPTPTPVAVHAETQTIEIQPTSVPSPTPELTPIASPSSKPKAKATSTPNTAFSPIPSPSPTLTPEEKDKICKEKMAEAQAWGQNIADQRNSLINAEAARLREQSANELKDHRCETADQSICIAEIRKREAEALQNFRNNINIEGVTTVRSQAEAVEEKLRMIREQYCE